MLRLQNYINGKQVPPTSEKYLENVCPSTGENYSLIPDSDKTDVNHAVEAAKKCKFSDIVTLSGHSEENPLNGIGDINLWVDSKAYNFVENIHQIWLLSLVDLIIGDREYSA